MTLNQRPPLSDLGGAASRKRDVAPPRSARPDRRNHPSPYSSQERAIDTTSEAERDQTQQQITSSSWKASVATISKPSTPDPSWQRSDHASGNAQFARPNRRPRSADRPRAPQRSRRHPNESVHVGQRVPAGVPANEDARNHALAIQQLMPVGPFDIGPHGCAITTPSDRSSTASCLRVADEISRRPTRPDSALSRAADALAVGRRPAVSLHGGLGRFAGCRYRTSLNNSSPLQLPASSRDHRIRARMLGTVGATLADFVRLRRSVSPGLRRSPASGRSGDLRPRGLGSRAAGSSRHSAAVTGRVRVRFVRGFGCVVPWLAGRCQRRRPSHVPLGRVLGAGRRARLGDCGW